MYRPATLGLPWIAALVGFVTTSDELPAPCESQVYCKGGPGTMLHAVQMARIFPDSKTFVDMPMKFEEATVLEKYQELLTSSGENELSKEDLQKFVDDNFLPPGSEFADWEPSDWKDEVELFSNIKDEKYKELAKFIHSRWKDLGRKIKSEVEGDTKSSLIYMPHPFIVPGGRFREVYYWDSYWTILGLLASEMKATVKGMLENFAGLIQTYGHIPNGNRIYYIRRSQPPFYISMVEAYHKATGDDEFLKANLDSMSKEFDFWMTNRIIDVEKDGKTYSLARYNVEVDLPRPEGYVEDFNLTRDNTEGGAEKQEMYMNLKTGAESGLDYSTKWFVGDKGEVTLHLKDIKARHIIPVELNAYLCKNARVLKEFYKNEEDTEKEEKYAKHEESFREGIDKVLWNEEDGTYYDFDLQNKQQRKSFFVTNVAPFWADCFKDTKQHRKASKIVDYIKAQTEQFPGGVPTSLFKSGQQWDKTNIWPPMQELVTTALTNTGLEEGTNLARVVATKYLQNVYCNFEAHNRTLYEKYPSDYYCGSPSDKKGDGGEYEVQEGFGWTNGVAMHYLNVYGSSISPDDPVSSSPGLETSFPLVTYAAVATTTLRLMS